MCSLLLCEVEDNSIDIEIGDRIKNRRNQVGMSQYDLGRRVGVSFQQIQKYEKGQNKITIGRLFKIANALDVELSFFFSKIAQKQTFLSLEEDQDGYKANVIDNKEVYNLVKAYSLVSEDKVRKKILDLVKVLGSSYAAPFL